MKKYVTLFTDLQNLNNFLRATCPTLKDQVNFFVYKNYKEINMV